MNATDRVDKVSNESCKMAVCSFNIKESVCTFEFSSSE